MDWVLVGYVAKQRTPQAGWRGGATPADFGVSCSEPIDEICSVSNCIARGYRNDDDPLGLFVDAEQAWAAVPSESRADCALYAYRLRPLQYEDGQEEGIDIWWAPIVEPLAKTFVRLGWDAVEGGNGYGFGCSPLSCNAGADIVRSPHLNRYCLVGDEQAAIALARSFSISKPEPGPYCVVEVWRDATTVAERAVAPAPEGID